ncbi:MAG: alkaline shock response membrane anchor protein AmaP [Anaerolineaceae bacterium]
MNVFRRILLVFYSLLVIAAAGGLIGLAWNQDRKLDISLSDLNLQAFITSTDSAKIAFTAICGAVALFGLLTLIIAVLRPSKETSSGTLRMTQADGGTVEVTSGAIESLLRQELESYPEVRKVTPRVRVSGGAVDTYLDASIDPGANIANITTMLGQGVASVLRDQVGVTNVRRPSIKIGYDTSSDGRPNGSSASRKSDARPVVRADIQPVAPAPQAAVAPEVIGKAAPPDYGPEPPFMTPPPRPEDPTVHD